MLWLYLFSALGNIITSRQLDADLITSVCLLLWEISAPAEFRKPGIQLFSGRATRISQMYWYVYFISAHGFTAHWITAEAKVIILEILQSHISLGSLELRHARPVFQSLHMFLCLSVFKSQVHDLQHCKRCAQWIFLAWSRMMNAVMDAVRRCDWTGHLVKAERSGWWGVQYVRDWMNRQIGFLSSSFHWAWLCFLVTDSQIHLDAIVIAFFHNKPANSPLYVLKIEEDNEDRFIG